ncbi:T9SS type A sorting domain-containing protein [Bacteroidota bacterium]
MNRAIYSISLFFILQINVYTQWSEQYYNFNVYFYAVSFWDNNQGYAVGENTSYTSGKVFRTTNGGDDWIDVPGEGNTLYAVCSPAFNIGIATGAFGTIIKTTDGGSSWTSRISGTDRSLRAVFFMNENIGMIVGSSSTFLKTTDQGETWVPKPCSAIENFYDVYFADSTHGWAVGYKQTWDTGPFIDIPRVVKTTDAGESWISLPYDAFNTRLQTVYFDDTDNGWAGGLQDYEGDPWAVLIKTTDGGNTWNSQVNSKHGWIKKIRFCDQNNGWAVGFGNVWSGQYGLNYKTTDGGNSWVHQTSLNDITLNNLFFLNPGTGWGTALKRIYKYETDCLEVWPGDANNDGIVNVSDILPLGLYYNNDTGPGRPGGGCLWESQCCPLSPPWSPANTVYADCNGDGIVNAADVLCIGLNYNNVHKFPLSKRGYYEKINDKDKPRLKLVLLDINKRSVRINQVREGSEYYIETELVNSRKPLGVALSIGIGGKGRRRAAELVGGWEIDGMRLGNMWGKGALSLIRENKEEGIIEAGMTNRSIEVDESGNIISRIKIRIINKKEFELNLRYAEAMMTNGKLVELLKFKEMDIETKNIANEIELSCYPNPFNPTTTIGLFLNEEKNVELAVFNTLGEVISELINGKLNAGYHEVEFDGTGLASGIYFYLLKTKSGIISKKMSLIR